MEQMRSAFLSVLVQAPAGTPALGDTHTLSSTQAGGKILSADDRVGREAQR